MSRFHADVMQAALAFASALEAHKDEMTDDERYEALVIAYKENWCVLCGGMAKCYCASVYDE